MIFSLTIGGSAKQLLAGSLNIHQAANGRSTASFRLDSVDRSYRPPIDAEVIMEEDGVRVFGGLIDRPFERGMFKGSHPGIRTTVNAVDFHVYTEWRYVNETLAAGTLKSQLQTLVTNYLSIYGVTLHVSQVDGPSMPELVLDYVRLDQVLNQLMALTADAGQPFVWRMSNTKVLRAYQPSTALAPFDLIGNDLPEVIGDIEVEPSNDGKANRVIVKVTPRQVFKYVESIIGDGTPGPFPLTYTLTDLTYGVILLDTGGGETLGIPPDSPLQWEYDPVTNTVTRAVGNTTNGTVYSFTYDGIFQGTWTATDPSWNTTPREKVITLESIPDDTTGQVFADSELAKSLEGPTFVRYHTWEQGIEPGQQQTINVSARNVNATAVITEVVITDKVHRLERYVTAVADDTQTNLDRGWTDVYRLWAGDKTGAGGTVSVGSGGGTATGPAAPFESVQFNRSGSFGGDAAFTYDEDTNSLVCGGGESSITAADHESCQVFGYDCHITD